MAGQGRYIPPAAPAATAGPLRPPLLLLQSTPSVPSGFSAAPPALDPDVEQAYLPVVVSDQAALRYLSQETRRTIDPERIQLVYEPALLGLSGVRFVDRKRAIDEQTDQLLLVPPASGFGGVAWGDAERLAITQRDLRTAPERVNAEQGPFFAPAPESANSSRELSSLKKELADWLYYNSRLMIRVHSELDVFQKPGERERDFKIRLQQVARERRDNEVDKLEESFDRKIDRLQDKLRKAERDLASDEAEHSARKQQEIVGIGESVLGWVLGRRSTRTLSTAANRRRMTARAGQEVDEARDEIEDLKREIAELEQELKEQAEEITVKWASILDDITTEEITPRRTDVDTRAVMLAWLPSWVIQYTNGGRPTSDTVAAYQLPAVG
ncbi:MAG: hypothetical protein R2932_04305 [Caldilineaceae bacterium]